MDKLCNDLVSDPKWVCFYFALVLGIIILIIWKVFGVGGCNKNNAAAERLVGSGVEIPPNYVCDTELTHDVIPNAYVNGTGGITLGAAGRHGQVPSDYLERGRVGGYIYTTRLDENTRDYSDVVSPAWEIAHPGMINID